MADETDRKTLEERYQMSDLDRLRTPVLMSWRLRFHGYGLMRNLPPDLRWRVVFIMMSI